MTQEHQFMMKELYKNLEQKAEISKDGTVGNTKRISKVPQVTNQIVFNYSSAHEVQAQHYNHHRNKSMFLWKLSNMKTFGKANKCRLKLNNYIDRNIDELYRNWKKSNQKEMKMSKHDFQR